jgi:hypothetical protein
LLAPVAAIVALNFLLLFFLANQGHFIIGDLLIEGLLTANHLITQTLVGFVRIQLTSGSLHAHQISAPHNLEGGLTQV